MYYKGMYKASITGPRNDSYVTLPLYKSKLGRNKLQHLLFGAGELGMNLYVFLTEIIFKEKHFMLAKNIVLKWVV